MWKRFDGDFDLEHVKDHKLPKLENVEPEDDVDSEDDVEPEDDVEYFIDPEDPEDREFVLREKLANLLKPLAAHKSDNLITAPWRKRAQRAASEITTLWKRWRAVSRVLESQIAPDRVTVAVAVGYNAEFMRCGRLNRFNPADPE